MSTGSSGSFSNQNPKARIFISCGQRDEKGVGLKVYKNFEDKFRPYYAETIHTAEGVENIFNAIKNTEYFIGINFKRDTSSFGSLFVQQELAIASFLKVPLLFFQQEGVEREGVAKYLTMVRPISFRDETDLLEKIDKETKDWDPDWTNELIVKRGTVDPSVTLNNDLTKRQSDWYHIEIFNNNRFSIARNCMGYVSKIVKLDDPTKKFELPTLELNWAGLGSISANILPKSPRELDAFFIIKGESIINFQTRVVYTNLSRFNYPRLNKGIYNIEYTIISDNFLPVKKEFKLDFGGDYNSIKFTE